MNPAPHYLVLITALASFAAVSGSSATPSQPWYERALVGMEIGPTGAQFGYSDANDARYCARFDGREIVRRAVKAHSEYLVLWVRDGDYAYYDSKLLPKAPGLGRRGTRVDAAVQDIHEVLVLRY